MESYSERKDFSGFNRILIKLGTNVTTTTEGCAALGRIGHMVEQIAQLKQQGKEVIVVTSGSIGLGRQKLQRQNMMSSSLHSHMEGIQRRSQWSPRECAAAGQSYLQSMFESLFSHHDITCAQILVTDKDFSDEKLRTNLRQTISGLLRLGFVPIVNENDVISTRETPLTDESGLILWDNDSLAALLACDTFVDLLVVLGDSNGLYAPVKGQGCAAAGVVPTILPRTTKGTSAASCDSGQGEKSESDSSTITGLERLREVREGSLFLTTPPGSRLGPGGYILQAGACLRAVNSGIVKAAVIVSGLSNGSILDVVNGVDIGTYFALEGGSEEKATPQVLHSSPFQRSKL